MSVKILTNVEQLAVQNSVFQLGTDQQPCTILYGTSGLDKGKRYRAIKIIPPEGESFDVLKASKLVKVSARGDKMVAVKVSDQDTSFDKCSGVCDLSHGVLCKLILRTYHYEFKGKKGISLQCCAVSVIGKKKTEKVSYTFL